MILQEYLKYTEKSASPESYNAWSFLSMVAAILGKKVHIKCNYFNVYPNMYVILASMPGVGKKSTTMRTARGLVEDTGIKVNYSNDSQTPQALMIEMQDCYDVIDTPSGKLFGSSALTILASELVSLLSYGSPMIDFLTDIYDSDRKFEYKTKNAGVVEIKNPCLNILSGVTTDMLNARVIKDAANGGFMSRSIIVYDNEIRHSSAFNMPGPEQLEARTKVVDRLTRIANLYGEITFTREALDLYSKFEQEESKALQLQPVNVEFRSRKPIHALKLSMLIAASELRLTITPTDVTVAIEMLQRVDHNMKFIFMSAGTHKNAEIHSRIILALGRVAEIDYSDMLSHFMTSVDEETFSKSIDTLVNVNWIELTRYPKTKSMPSRITMKLTAKGKEMFHKYN